MSEFFLEMQRRYRERELPWDQELPPPELIAIAAELAPGRALDLGCGLGRAGIYLAARGWDYDGVDFVPEAIDLAVQRAAAAGLATRLRFHIGSVTDLSFLQPAYDLAIDVGCMHALRGDELSAYAAGLRRLLRAGARYMLFVRLRDQQAEQPRGLPAQTVYELFEADWQIDRVEYGETVVPQGSWSSAWFWMTRRAQ